VILLQDFFFTRFPLFVFYLLSLLFFFPYAVVKVQRFPPKNGELVVDSKRQVSSLGGLKWTRTTDLALIRRTL
jgi:hypothetical protein